MSACDSPVDAPTASTLEAAFAVTSADAGAEVPGGVAVRVLDQRDRPLARVPVTFVVNAGGGSVASPASPGGAASTSTTVTTGVDGVAKVTWVLGVTAGSNALTAAVPGLSPVLFAVDGRAGPPTSIRIEAGDAQTGTVGAALASPPAVRLRDAHGNAVPGARVAFQPGDGSGTVSSTQVVTDAAGLASAGAWTLGTTAGAQLLHASAEGVEGIAIRATALPGPATTLERVTGNGQTATVATAVAVPPAVAARDAYGNRVSGAAITFAITGGGGSITAPSGVGGSGNSLIQSADNAGIASVPAWVLGQVAGPNQLRAALASGASVDFDATGTPGAPAVVRVRQGEGQTAAPGTPVAVTPAVFVGDSFDNPIPGARVVFAVTSGGGSLTGALATANPYGIAVTGVWTLGPAAGQNSITATVAGLPAVMISATASTGGGGGSPGSFDIDVRFVNPVTAQQQAAFNAAAGRWMATITGDLPAVPVSFAAGSCGVAHPAITETVDDLLILVSVETIDGPGKILGSAGPCFVRSASALPVVGVILIDVADLTMLEGGGMLTPVILHEIGHVLGVGTLWNTPPLIGAGSGDPYFTGSGAVSAFVAAGGSTYAGTPVPVENTGGSGTRDGHWRESIFGSELMTGWINAGSNPLSAITVASLADIGFTVNLLAADGYSVSTGIPAQSSEAAPPIELHERRLPFAPVPIDARGGRVGPKSR